jgi:RNA-directed DNA polymerase
LVLDGDWVGLGPLVGRLSIAFGDTSRPPARRVEAFLWADLGFQSASEPDEEGRSLGVAGWIDRLTPVMWPATGRPSAWDVPAIVTPTELADRLGVSRDELDWLADCQGRERRTPDGPGRRYDYRWVAKRTGSSRLVEAPRSRLRSVQRRLLKEIVRQIPPHEAAHGFCKGRSVGTFVAPHVGRRVVLKLDLRDFFTTITAARVTALFLTAGYPEAVARAISGLCTNCVPSTVLSHPAASSPTPDSWRARRALQAPHLPQGAPTSPSIANSVAFRLDARLTGLAASAGAAYTRYADDLAFSGGRNFERSVDRFLIHASAIVIEEGFAIHPRKTRVMRQGVRQRLAGAVINERPNLAREAFDILKATLHNCLTHGALTQNRDGHPDFRAHLLGRLAHLGSLNPERARRLRTIFDRIDWSTTNKL